MFRNAIVIVLLFIILAGFVGCKPQFSIPVDPETAKELALKAAKKDKRIDFKPYDASEAGFDNPYSVEQYFLHKDFTDYHFIYVWSELAHAENKPFAVSPGGSVFKLPEDFSLLTEDRGLLLEHEDDARDLLEFYLVFNTVIPGSDKHLVLSSVHDIPCVEDEENQLETFHDLIKPVAVTEHAGVWEFDFFTWRAVEGVLFHWKAAVGRFGEVDLLSREILDKYIGAYVMIE